MEKWQLQEFIKCKRDCIYFIENYCKILHPELGIIPFKLYDFQKDILQKFEANQYNITNKSRQTGVSTLTASYALWHCLFAKNKEVIILSIKDADAQDFLRKVKLAFYELPEWLIDEPKVDNAHRLVFSNDSMITSAASASHATRGRTPSMLIIDEAGFIDKIEDIWTAALPTLARGGKSIIISTPAGIGNFFHDTWEKSQPYTPKVQRNQFVPTFVHWTQIPEYRGFDDVSGMTFEEIVTKAKQNPWYQKLRPNISDKKWAQEFEGDFLGSGNTVVNQNSLKAIRDLLKDPIKKFDYKITGENDLELVESEDADLWVWKEPESNRLYIVGADVSSGDGSDYSAAQVMDVMSGEQVAEFQGILNTNYYSKLLSELCIWYNYAFLVPEITGLGYGVVHNLLYEDGYTNIYQTKDEMTKKNKKAQYGWQTTTKTRPLLIQSIQNYVNSGEFQFYSLRLWKELGAFVWKNGKAEADGKSNDDLVMAASIANYNRETALQQLPMGLSISSAEQIGVFDNQIVDPYTLEPYSIKTSNEITDTAEDINKWLLGR